MEDKVRSASGPPMTLTALPEASILNRRCHRGWGVSPLASQEGAEQIQPYCDVLPR
jgi:hypothetical protein